MAKKSIKKCSDSLTIRKTQIKTTMMFPLFILRMAITQKSKSNKCWQGCREKGSLIYSCWEYELVQSWKQYGDSSGI